MVNGISTIALTAQNPGSPSESNTAADLLSGFVVGPENALPASALQACLDHAIGQLTPLLLYGPHGSGKTHLARGLAAWWQRHFPTSRVICLTASDFAQSYAAAIAEDRLGNWRRQIREADLLVIDDLGQLTGKHGGQQELRQALDELGDREKLAVMTAQTLPTHLRVLLPSLRSRLSAGLAVPLVLPARTTRRFILDRVAMARGISLSQRSRHTLADGLKVSVPALVAALLELELSARVDQQAIDGGRVRQFMAARPSAATPELREIAARTAKYFGLKISDLKSPLRHQSLVAGRSMAMYLARQLTAKSLGQIGEYFGGRDHTTVLHGCRRTEKLLVRDQATRQAVADLKRALAP